MVDISHVVLLFILMLVVLFTFFVIISIIPKEYVKEQEIIGPEFEAGRFSAKGSTLESLLCSKYDDSYDYTAIINGIFSYKLEEEEEINFSVIGELDKKLVMGKKQGETVLHYPQDSEAVLTFTFYDGEKPKTEKKFLYLTFWRSSMCINNYMQKCSEIKDEEECKSRDLCKWDDNRCKQDKERKFSGLKEKCSLFYLYTGYFGVNISKESTVCYNEICNKVGKDHCDEYENCILIDDKCVFECPILELQECLNSDGCYLRWGVIRPPYLYVCDYCPETRKCNILVKEQCTTGCRWRQCFWAEGYGCSEFFAP